MKTTNENTTAALTARRLVPVVVIDDAGTAPALGAALREGGLPVAEVTLRTPAALDAISSLSRLEGMCVGAGTVITAAQADAAIDAGASYLVSPGWSASVAERAGARGVLHIPGVATATEIVAALDRGIELMKFFPAEPSGGVPALRAFSAVFDAARFLPTGGIDVSNLADYLAVPSVAAVGGSWMVPRRLVAAGDVTALRDLVADAVTAAQAE